MTDGRTDGGAAFPLMPPIDPTTGFQANGYPYPEMGMSRRDWFAGQALQGLLTGGTVNPRGAGFEEFVATTAVNLADAMLASLTPAGG